MSWAGSLLTLTLATAAVADDALPDQTLVFYNARLALRDDQPTEVLKLWLLRNSLVAQGERGRDGHWTLVPAGPTTNETLVNGRALVRASLLSAGDRIAVGREAKGIAKLPLTVRAG